MTLSARNLYLLPLLCLCVGLALGVASDSPCLAAPDEEASDDCVVLPLAKGNTLAMEDLLKFASESLGYPILYNRDEVSGATCSFTTAVSIPRSDFQGFFERLLLSNGFVYVESGEGTSRVHRVVHVQVVGRFLGSDVSKNVSLEELDQYADRGLVLSTVIPLKNVACRDMLSSLASLVGQGGGAIESIRSVDNANALVVTSVAAKVIRIAKICAEMDRVAGAADSGTVRAIAELKTSMSAMKKKIAALESRLARSGTK